MLSKRGRKAFVLLLAGTLTVCGTGAPRLGVKAAADISLLCGSDISHMFNSDEDNTWLFAGGVETQGRFEEIRGTRNFVGQFEEYIRWTKASKSELQRQRYMINVGKAGQDIVTFEKKLDGYISSLSPKAVAYLIGEEDYSKGDAGIEDFKKALTSVIEKALAMKENGGYAVIQLPHAVKNTSAAANIKKYVEAAKAVVTVMDASKRPRVVLVDHYTQTDNDDFKNNKLTEDDRLNADGHYEIAKQLAEKTEGMSATFPTLSKWTEEAGPDEYLDKAPSVTATANGLNVTIPADVAGDKWNYTVTADGTEISGIGTGASFVIDSLPAGEAYELEVKSADGTRQLHTVCGTITAGNQGGNEELSDMQQAIVDKVEGKKPLTWLFMGDSITHAALWTNGYDGIAQIMEKYVREDLGRSDDIFINTGNSGATSGVENRNSTLANIEQRLTKYKPDIVVLMIGTNDAGAGATNESYKANLEAIVKKIKETNPDAAIVFRSPTPAKTGNYNSKIEGGYLDAMKSVAEANGILYIDQYTDWKEEFDTYPYLWGGDYYFGSKTKADNLHPGAAGQLKLAKQFIAACGLNTDTEIADLSYEFKCTETQNENLPGVFIFQDEIQVTRNGLQELLGGGEIIGDYTVVLTDGMTNRTYTKTAGVDEQTVVISDLPMDRTYTMTVTVNMAGGEAKHVTFAAQHITLYKNTNVAF